MQLVPDWMRDAPWRPILLLFLASRGALLIVALLGGALLPSGADRQVGNFRYPREEPIVLDVWARWDSEWYLAIADHGYQLGELTAQSPLGYRPDAAAGSFPVYPLLIAVLAPVLGSNVAAGVLISNLSLLLALLLIHRMAADGLPTESANAAGLASCVALLLFPTSLFLSAVYAESLFLMLSLLAVHASARGRTAQASLAAAAAALTRPVGVFLLIPLGWDVMARFAAARGARWRAVVNGLPLLAVPASIAGWMLYLEREFGDPLAFLRRAQHWLGPMGPPWRAFIRWWEAGPVLHGAHGSTVELVMALVVLALIPLFFLRLRPQWALYGTVLALLPLTSSLWSFGRLALPIFPIYLVIGQAWARGARAGPVLYGFVGASVGALFTAMFAAWWWVG